jgi:hypothetical protein
LHLWHILKTTQRCPVPMVDCLSQQTTYRHSLNFHMMFHSVRNRLIDWQMLEPNPFNYSCTAFN